MSEYSQIMKAFDGYGERSKNPGSAQGGRTRPARGGGSSGTAGHSPQTGGQIVERERIANRLLFIWTMCSFNVGPAVYAWPTLLFSGSKKDGIVDRRYRMI
jgi:hypothetical protein